jgi:hypothetical protein
MESSSGGQIMNPVDELLAQEPLAGLFPKLQRMTSEDECRTYVFDHRNGIVEAYAKLLLLNGGSNALEGELAHLKTYIGRAKTTLMNAIETTIKELKKKRIQDDLGDEVKIEDLHITKGGELVTDYHNMWLFAKTELWNIFSFDIFTGHTYCIAPGPWCSDEEKEKFEFRLRNESDVTRCTIWMNTKGLNPRRNDVGHIVECSADLNKIDRYKDWMDALPEWDGIPRLDTWLFDHCGAEPNEITSLYGRKFVMSMVVRCYEPGELAKNVLILEGKQNIGKSRLVEVMGGPFYVEQAGARNLDLTKADSQMILQGASVVEIPENVLSKRSDADMIKGYFSTKTSRIRRAYGKDFEFLVRRNVFVITLNPDHTKQYLTDPTGNIRYFPVECGANKDKSWQINIPLFKDSWPQIIAEAIVARRSGEQYYLTVEQQELQIENLETREVENPAEHDVKQFLIRTKSLYEDFGFETAHIMKYLKEELRETYSNQAVSNALGHLGFVKEKFTLTRAEKERLPKGVTTNQINLWIPVGQKKHIDDTRKGNGGNNIPLDYTI